MFCPISWRKIVKKTNILHGGNTDTQTFCLVLFLKSVRFLLEFLLKEIELYGEGGRAYLRIFCDFLIIYTKGWVWNRPIFQRGIAGRLQCVTCQVLLLLKCLLIVFFWRKSLNQFFGRYIVKHQSPFLEDCLKLTNFFRWITWRIQCFTYYILFAVKFFKISFCDRILKIELIWRC